MLLHRPASKLCLAVLVWNLSFPWGPARPRLGSRHSQRPRRQPQTTTPQASASLSFVRSFSSADDVKPEHPILDRTLDIIAGPADPVTHVDALKSPSAVATHSNHRIFVADPGAHAVHIFDFVQSKYARLGRTWRPSARSRLRRLRTVKTTYTSSTKAAEPYLSTTRQEDFVVTWES